MKPLHCVEGSTHVNFKLSSPAHAELIHSLAGEVTHPSATCKLGGSGGETPRKMLPQLTAIDITLQQVGNITSASRKCQYNINHQMCHMKAKICFHCCHCPSTITHPYTSTPLLHPHDFPLTVLTHLYALAPLPHPHDFPQPLPPHVHPHSSLCFHTPAAPSEFPYNAASACPPSPILTILHPCLILMLPLRPHDSHPRLPPHIQPHPYGLPSSSSCCALMIYLQHFHHMSTLTHPYALAPLPTLMISLQGLHPISALTHT
ncbi:hypothetical protein O181_017192 [Austropuccinia psidii MF-1]|uniref:Uncharacterized protein n=1 Tax=Austropuccinia psidii MF-1 TaxID=1389203 RepID=A0A9Q3GSC8_9BASI|nr:hypothetical protein [Austropuccinia psidii MF-1]